MSKFLVTNGSNFTPFTYDELVKPLMYVQEQHNKAQDVYDQLGLEMSAIEHYITDNPDDADAKAMYDGYKKKLAALQQNLWDNGVTVQTRRDLAAAKSAYASDIARLQTAIKRRQDTSAAYWKAKHEHPELVMGADPGRSGLDLYLRDDNYGNDYYSYNGASFMTQVGADAKALSSDLVRSLGYDRTSVPGYITRIERTGFTSKEVDDAAAAVRASMKPDIGDAAFTNLSEPSLLLAKTLMSHLQSTGAVGRLDDDELDRLVEYGRAGLSQAIGKIDRKDFNDKEYDFGQALMMKGIRSNPGAQRQEEQGGYSLNTVIRSLESDGAKDLAQSLKGVNKHYDHEIPFTTADGNPTTVYDAWTMTNEVYNPEIRRKTREQFGGLDVALPGNSTGRLGEQTGYIVDANGNEQELKTRDLSDKECDELGVPHGSVGIYCKGHIQKGMTINFNKARVEYETHLENIKKNNPDLDLDDYAISPKKERKLREKYGIDARVDSSEISAIISTKETVGEYSPAMLVSTDSGDDYARNNFGRSLIASAKDYAGTVSKGSPYAFYKVSKGGISVSQEGETDWKKVFGEKPDAASISYISVLPQDVAKGAGNGRPQIRFSTTASDGVWATDATMFGSQVYNALKTPVYGGDAGVFAGYTVSDAVAYMMMPLLKPENMMLMSDKQAAAWAEGMYDLLNYGSDGSTVVGPVVYNGNKPIAVTGKDIVRNGALRSRLYGCIVDYINKAMRAARDVNSNDHGQWKGNSSTKSPDFE